MNINECVLALCGNALKRICAKVYGRIVSLAVPELLTPQEARAVPRRRRLLLAAGVVATLVSIPMLALALKLTHVFEFLMQSSGRS